MKPQIAYADLVWMSDFEKVKTLGEGSRIADIEILWIHEDPYWVQIKKGKEKQMIRKGEPFPKELTGSL